MVRLTWKALLAHDPRGEDRWCCPFPPCDEKVVNADHRSLSIDPDTGAYLCHRCGRKGKLNVQSVNCPFKPEGMRQQRARSDEWKGIWESSFLIPDNPNNIYYSYLLNRGLDIDCNLRDIRMNPSFYGAPSIVFGIRDWMGNLIGCQGRRINPPEGWPKVMTAAGSQQGIFLSRPAAILADPLIICESPIDALSLDVMGYPAISVQGTQLPEWINYLTYYRRVLICPDRDEAGCVAAESWKNSVISRGTYGLLPLYGKDWNESMMNDPLTRIQLGMRLEDFTKGGGFHPMKSALELWFTGGGGAGVPDVG